jgi:SMI1/KNR4 family protein SUKH-1
MSFPTAEEYVRRAEQALGLALPAALRARLLEENGGGIEVGDESWELFPVEDTSDRKHRSRTANHLVGETEQARELPEFPADAVAIAANGSGDYLILQPSANNRLSDDVWLWDHETGTMTVVEVTWSIS